MGIPQFGLAGAVTPVSGRPRFRPRRLYALQQDTRRFVIRVLRHQPPGEGLVQNALAQSLCPLQVGLNRRLQGGDDGEAAFNLGNDLCLFVKWWY